MKVVWSDAGLEPRCPANPAYPDGIDLDLSHGAELTCVAALPYPAKRIGSYTIECPLCGTLAACTTAGRADDPRSIKIACAPGMTAAPIN